MIEIKFYKEKEGYIGELKFAVIMAEYKEKWIMVRHKDRATWEIPGGHIEPREKVEDAAKRELYEETGATHFSIEPVSIYSVIKDRGVESFGKLFYAKVEELGPLPDSEIVERRLMEALPEDLTYPLIQPALGNRVMDFKKEIEIREVV